MLRGIFGAPGISKEAQDWYVSLLKKVAETPEGRSSPTRGIEARFSERGGFRQVA